MPEPITLSVVAISALTALAGDFLKGVAKKSPGSLKELFKGDESRAVLNDAFQEFKAYCFNENSSTEEKILLRVFEEFFTDDRTIGEFQLVFAGQSHQVDFNLMEEIFVGCCIENKIEIPTFDFFRALSHVIKSIETIAQKEETFKKAIETSKLEDLYNALQKRDRETNLTFARFKYLHQLSRHNNRLQFTGIPDPKEKKDIELPEVFVMQRAGESVPGEDYRQLVREHEGDKAFSDEEVHLRRIMPVHREETRPAVKFNRVLEESDNHRFVVLGKPGSGKSSLLKFLMLTAAQKHLEFHRDSRELLFPIFVEIRKLEHALAGSIEPDYNILEFLYDSMSREYGLRLPGGFFESYLDRGKALLLFDGLDEVAAEPRRAEVRRMISAFITSRHPGGIETYFYHCHFFVMKFIAEQGQWLDNKEFVEKQVDDFFKFSWNEGKDRGYYKNYTWQRFNDWLSSVSDSTAGSFLYKKLLSAAEDKTLDVDLRSDCAEAVGQLGHKDKAVDILVDLYLAQPDKTETDARLIYDSLWELTVV